MWDDHIVGYSSAGKLLTIRNVQNVVIVDKPTVAEAGEPHNP